MRWQCLRPAFTSALITLNGVSSFCSTITATSAPPTGPVLAVSGRSAYVRRREAARVDYRQVGSKLACSLRDEPPGNLRPKIYIGDKSRELAIALFNRLQGSLARILRPNSESAVLERLLDGLNDETFVIHKEDENRLPPKMLS